MEQIERRKKLFLLIEYFQREKLNSQHDFQLSINARFDICIITKPIASCRNGNTVIKSRFILDIKSIGVGRVGFTQIDTSYHAVISAKYNLLVQQILPDIRLITKSYSIIYKSIVAKICEKMLQKTRILNRTKIGKVY